MKVDSHMEKPSEQPGHLHTEFVFHGTWDIYIQGKLLNLG